MRDAAGAAQDKVAPRPFTAGGERRCDTIPSGALINGRYRLFEVVGDGGMATVYRGHDERLGRDVAVKVSRLSSDLPAPPLLEERVSSALLHDHIVSIFDAGEIRDDEPGAGCAYIVMQYVAGTTALDIAPLPWRRAVEIVAQAADGLAAAHERGIVHCDVKPSNLLVDDNGRTLVADFGVAAEAESEVGDFVHGSPAYIAPERLRGERPDPRVDVYGLGGVLAYLLTGEKPGDEAALHVPPSVPRALVGVIARARSRDPRARFADAGAFKRALEEAMSERTPDGARADQATRQVDISARRRPETAAARSPDNPERSAPAAAPRVSRSPAPHPTAPPRTLSRPYRAPNAATGPQRSGAPLSPVSRLSRERQAALVAVAGLALLFVLLAGIALTGSDPASSDTIAASVEMPDVRGQTFGPAIAALAEQGVVVDRVEIVYAPGYLNEVADQSPAPGETVSDDDVVTLIVRTRP